MRWSKVLLAMSISVGLLAVAGCGDDDASPTGPSQLENDLVGIWVDDEDSTIVWTFESGGKYEEDDEGDKTTGTWQLNGNTLKITATFEDDIVGDDDDEIFEVSFSASVSISGSKMTLDFICDAIVITSEDLSATLINAVIEAIKDECQDNAQDTFTKQ